MKRISRIFVFLVALILLIPKPALSWTKTLGEADHDIGYCVQQTTDGGLIMCGVRDATIPSLWIDGKSWMIKTDADGEIEWSRIYYPGEIAGAAYYVEQTSENDYIVTGSMSGDLWLARIDVSGDTIWTRKFGDAIEERGYCVQELEDGNFIVAGTIGWGGGGDNLVWLLKVNEEGDTIWSQKFDGEPWTAGFFVQEIAGGGFILTGVNDDCLWLLKCDENGETVWTRLYETQTTGESWGQCVVETYDNGFIIVGINNHKKTGDIYSGMLWLLKTDENGDTIWTKKYGGTYQDFGYCIEQTPDSGYIIIGSRDYDMWPSGGNLWILRTDSDGDTVWTRTYGKEDGDRGYSIEMTDDNGFIVSGYTEPDGEGNRDLWLLKTNMYGDTIWYDITATRIVEPSGDDPIDRLAPRVMFTHLGTMETQDFYVHCEITSKTFHTANYHDSVLVSSTFEQADSIEITFADWYCDDNARYETTFYSSKDAEPLWNTTPETVEFQGTPWSGVVEETPLVIDISAPEVGIDQISFFYSTPTNTPYTLRIFDVTGRDVHSQSGQFEGSGQITCSLELTPGVYFWGISTDLGDESGKFVYFR